jgi:hypothetical protein
MLRELGILSGLLIIVADIPYIWNAYRGKTQPHRVTWFIIFLINLIGLANQHASGAKSSLLYFVGATFITFLVFLISLFNGVGGYKKLDILVLAGAMLGLLIWYLTNSPTASVIANTAVALIGIIPTFVKAYHHPGSETKITWLIGTISALFAVISVGKLSFALLLIPVYATVQQASLFALIEIRERHFAKTAKHKNAKRG